MASTRFLHSSDYGEDSNIFLGLGKGKGKGSYSTSKSKGRGSKSRSGSKGKGKGKGSDARSSSDLPVLDLDLHPEPEPAATSMPPAPVQTQFPTITQTASQTVLGTFLDIPSRSAKFCRANSQGTFGSESGESSLVVFVYQVETEPGTTTNKFETSILPRMETAVVDLMIPSMFDRICGLFRRLQVTGTGTGTYLGISAKPSDHVLAEVDCGPSFVQPCHVVSGFITAYSKGKTEAEVQAEVSLLLQNVFEFGNLPDLVPGVDGVEFRSGDPRVGTPSPTSIAILALDVRTPLVPLAPAPTTTTAPGMPTKVPTVADLPSQVSTNLQGKSPTDDTADGLAWWRWLLVAIIIVLMFVAIYVVWFRCSNKPRHASVPQDEQESYQDEDEDRGGF